jgi:phosphoribosylpyrophosphate synthetase
MERRETSLATSARVRAGCDRVIAVETQPAGSSQIDGFFSLPVENLRTTPICVEHLSKLRLSSPVIVAPNEATIQMASDVAAGLERRSGAPVGFAVTVESGPSRGTDRYVHRGPTALAP